MEKKDFKNAIHFLESSHISLYEQLANYIRIQIKSGFFQPGDKMLSETDLCEYLNIGRSTVRKSLELLVEEGLIIRYRRKGSFIADDKLKRSLNNLYNFSENMIELNAKPSSVVLKQSVESASAEISNILQLPPGKNEIFQLNRLRCANQQPIVIERTSIPYYLCPHIEEFDFSCNSLYHILSKNYSLNLYHATETISAVLIHDDDAKLLQCKSKDAGYKISRISHLDTGFIYEYTTSITRADKCEFQMELYKSKPGKNNIANNVHRNVTL